MDVDVEAVVLGTIYKVRKVAVIVNGTVEVAWSGHLEYVIDESVFRTAGVEPCKAIFGGGSGITRTVHIEHDFMKENIA